LSSTTRSRIRLAWSLAWSLGSVVDGEEEARGDGEEEASVVDGEEEARGDGEEEASVVDGEEEARGDGSRLRMSRTKPESVRSTYKHARDMNADWSETRKKGREGQTLSFLTGLGTKGLRGEQ
jgi:hypothetical protein